MKKKIDWEHDIYSKGLQLNDWPFTEVVSDVINATNQKNPVDLKFLEIGCGAGNNLWFAASRGFQIHGLDMSKTAIEYARKKLHAKGYQKIDLKVGSLPTIPWPDNFFDIVIDRGALTHSTYSIFEATASEVHRVLKKDGLFNSYTLFGLNHHDKFYGKEIENNTYDQFQGGYFATVGSTTFFDERSIRDRLRNFSNVKVLRSTKEDLNTHLLEEEYSFSCIK